MKKERSLKELLQIVVDSLKAGPRKLEFNYWCNNGICGEIDNLRFVGDLSSGEARQVYEFVDMNKPVNGSKYTKMPQWIDNIWWWNKMCEDYSTRDIRINFLEDLLKQLDDNENS